MVAGPIYTKRRRDRLKDGQDEVNRPRFLPEKEERYKVRRNAGRKELNEERHTRGKKILQKKNQERRGERKALRMIKTKKKVKENKARSISGTVTRYFLSKGSDD